MSSPSACVRGERISERRIFGRKGYQLLSEKALKTSFDEFIESARLTGFGYIIGKGTNHITVGKCLTNLEN